MQIEIEKIENLKLKAKVLIPVETIQQEKSKILKKIKKDVEIKGFRKGKVPEGMILKRFLKEVTAEANESVYKLFIAELEKKKLELFTQPTFNNLISSLDEAFQFESEFEIFPEFSLPEIKGLELKKLDEEIDKNTFEEYCYDYLIQFREWDEIDEPAKVYDCINCNLNFFDGDQELLDAKMEKSNIYLRKEKVEKDFESYFVGMKAKEQKEFHYHFPKDYNPVLSEKNLLIKAEILSVSRPQEVEINEKVFQQINEKFQYEEDEKIKSKEDFDKNINKMILENDEKEIEAENRKLVDQAIKAKLDFELPPTLIKNVVDEHANLLKQAKNDEEKEKLMSVEEYTDNYRLELFVEDYAREHNVQFDEVQLKQILQYYSVIRKHDKNYYQTSEGQKIFHRYRKILQHDAVIQDIISKN